MRLGMAIALLFYAGLLVVHVARFDGIYYGVPNVAGYAGRYPAFGTTWDMTAINAPAEIGANLSRSFRTHRTHPVRSPDGYRWVCPQVVAMNRRDAGRTTPDCWSPWSWVISGILGYAIAGAIVGAVASIPFRIYTRILIWRSTP